MFPCRTEQLPAGCYYPVPPALPVEGDRVPWVRIDDSITDHHKILEVGPLGLALQIRAICYSSRHLTDGVLPAAVVRLLTADLGEGWPELMVSAGLWEPVENGFQIHDYLLHQKSEAEVRSRTRVASEAKVIAGRKGGVMSGLRRREAAKQKTRSSEPTSHHSTAYTTTSSPIAPSPPVDAVENSGPGVPQQATMFHVEHSDGPTRTPKGALCETCASVVHYMNQAGGTKFIGRGAYLDMLHARHQEFGADACRQVCRAKAWDWIHSPQAKERYAAKRGDDMAQYYRPETLFRPRKFPQYMGGFDPGEFWKS